MNISEYPPLEPPSTSTHDFFKEQIVYLYYNLSRKDSVDIQSLSIFFDNLLGSLKKYICRSSSSEYSIYLIQLFKLLGQTRDCFAGKGEHEMSYMLLTVWYKYYPVLAIFALHKFVKPLSGSCSLGYGSWRDIKYLCEYLRLHTKDGIHHPLVGYAIQFMNKELKRSMDRWNGELDTYFLNLSKCNSMNDFENLEKPNARESLSTLVKWIPRENKKFDWIHEKLVIDWYNTNKPYMLSSFQSYEGYYAALDKCKMKYRQMIAKFNRQIDTTEIKMCSRQWDAILPQHIPQIAMLKNKGHLFYNNIVHSHIVMREVPAAKKRQCSQNFQKHFEKKFFIIEPFDFLRKHSAKLPNTPPISLLVKEAFALLQKMPVMQYTPGSQNIDLQIDILNCQWKQLTSILGYFELTDFIPMIDFSLDTIHNTDAFYTSIGLALLITERTSLGKRLIAIDHIPCWVNLEACGDFFSMIRVLEKTTGSIKHTHYNYEAAFELIIEAINDTQMSFRKIRKLSLVLFQCSPLGEDFHAKIQDVFIHKGLVGSRKKALPMPRMVYWNMAKSGSSLPCSPYSLPNTFFLSGFSSSLLHHLFTLQSLDTSKHSYDLICKILQDERYDELGNYIEGLLNR